MNNNIQENNNLQVKYINIQLIAIIGFIVSIIISFFIVYDEKLRLQNKQRIFTDEEYKSFVIFQSTLNLVLSLIFFYITYMQYNNSKEDINNNLNLQLVSSFLLVISAFIRLYLVLKYYKIIN